MNTPITFELAKLLKEKGFDSHCYQVYEKDGRLCTTYESSRWQNENPELIILAPTIGDSIMWLYEKHGIWIQAFILNKTFAWKAQNINTLVITCLYAQQDKGYNSPTEAYEAGIKYCLTELI